MVFKHCVWVNTVEAIFTQNATMVGLGPQDQDSSLRIASKRKQRRNQQQKVECEDQLEQQQYH